MSGPGRSADDSAADGDAWLLDMLTKREVHYDDKLMKSQLEALETMRRGVEMSDRVAKGHEYKRLANQRFAAGHHRVAVSGYLAGIWMVRRGIPGPCPREVAAHEQDLVDVGKYLRNHTAPNGWIKNPRAGNLYDEVLTDEVESSATLRTSLHLNLAAAALKLCEWSAARAACEVVVDADPKPEPALLAKALFRLAKANEGMSDHDSAIGAASHLAKLEPDNAEARRLLASLREQKKRADRTMFGGAFEKGTLMPEELGEVRDGADGGGVVREQKKRADRTMLGGAFEKGTLMSAAAGIDM